jgi:hypothetical protein
VVLVLLVEVLVSAEVLVSVEVMPVLVVDTVHHTNQQATHQAVLVVLKPV